MASFVNPGRPSAKNVDLSYAGKGNVFHPFRSEKLFFCCSWSKPCAVQTCLEHVQRCRWLGQDRNRHWQRRSRFLDWEWPSLSWKSCSDGARTRVAGLARDLQHTQCTPASASWSLLFSWSPVIKCQPDSRQRGEEVPVTRGWREALQECYQATDWL